MVTCPLNLVFLPLVTNKKAVTSTASLGKPSDYDKMIKGLEWVRCGSTLPEYHHFFCVNRIKFYEERTPDMQLIKVDK